MCHLLRSGVAAVFGPESGTTSSYIQSICDSMEIPHIETRWDYRVGPIREQYSINLYPYPPTLSKVIKSEMSVITYSSDYSELNFGGKLQNNLLVFA